MDEVIYLIILYDDLSWSQKIMKSKDEVIDYVKNDLTISDWYTRETSL